MLNTNYNPDVLSCIANLSSDEVFTPPDLVNQILDLLPPSLWKDKTITFLDPACKSGVFLREIAKRLDVGLEDTIPLRQKRMDHIFTKQLFGLAITELTALLARRSLYCSKHAQGKYSVCNKFKTDDGNIHYERLEHSWDGERCTFCGANRANYERGEELESHAYTFIHTENPEDLFKMKFDVIIGNPPYQLSDGGAGASAIPLYHKFVNQAIKMNPRFITMIIPSRWFAGGRGLDEFRKVMQSDKRIRTIVDYPKSRDCFPGVDIAGGVNYFLWDNSYKGNCEFVSNVNGVSNTKFRDLDEYEIIIRDNVGINVIRKVLSKKEAMMSDIVLSVSPFGLRSFIRGQQNSFEGSLTLISSSGESYIDNDLVSKNKEKIEHYKVCVGYLNPDRAGVNNAADGKINVTTKQKILCPREVVTETYIIPFSSENRVLVENCAGYLRTKFARFLISLTLTSMHITQRNFSFVPIQDFNEPWTDEKLYKKYKLSQEEIDFIESMIRPMELADV
ncbi:MAG TPA: Eco57I restriction-modification methylase domain-containing protein [Candidatus Cloacimonadota bacterium]|nr:Eco57I restriction-modification methylase domain-containing protein [Candidatus Cloacimonadota bacterium]